MSFYNDVDFVKTNNRRYTMKDIGELENRINMEYYTALSLLEKEIQSLNQDSNGLKDSSLVSVDL